MFPHLHSLETRTYTTVFIASDTGIIRKTSVLKPIQSTPQTPSHATPLSVNTTGLHEAQEQLHLGLNDAAALHAILEPKAASIQKKETPDDDKHDIETLRSFSSAVHKWIGLNAAACQTQNTPQHAESTKSKLRNLRVKLEHIREILLDRESSAPQTQDTSSNADFDAFRARLDELYTIVNCRLESESAAASKRSITEDGDSYAGVLVFGVFLGAFLTCYVALKCAETPFPFTLSCLGVAWLWLLVQTATIQI